ncbi:TPA: capsular biosynthesis protein [Burkholderia cepacia]|uniref:capsule biosynthesis protein n=1 Tax=Burkholderia cepacia TaxID=292 RepID=UPI001CF49998|nr:capsular biosynthesis protein [Burkholderia cepacia]MCA8361983.1 capsular biosynthesis protein [Burkholderia cepacia]HDR9759579.1 capsular biosynthesis protein [Burkholderia cepacia ATCC 25416]HDV6367631.1 capsular biosynthesis protein [Burkholderia cepacia]
MPRSFLTLQGPASPFFAHLSASLSARGHAVRRVNFCGGDLVYGERTAALNYTGKTGELSNWYDNILQHEGVTDVLMFGDCRAIHLPMHAIARARGVAVHVFEEGYVRPYWLTLERQGVNGRSALPRDPAYYLDIHGSIPPCPLGKETGYSLIERASHDIRYRAANLLFSRYFRHYVSHRPRNGAVEYLGLARRALSSGRQHANAQLITEELLTTEREYFLFPLQLNSDAQIVVHSPFSGICDAIERVMRSFASYAPKSSWLLIKNHPLDTGLIDYKRFANCLARELDIDDRLCFIDAGHLPTLLEHARGVVVVNSTVGLSALHHRRPLLALGAAIYSIDGLTWQGTLDAFWNEAKAPDDRLYRAFLDYVVHRTQINGDFYTRSGIEMATEGAIQRLEAFYD